MFWFGFERYKKPKQTVIVGVKKYEFSVSGIIFRKYLFFASSLSFKLMRIK